MSQIANGVWRERNDGPAIRDGSKAAQGRRPKRLVMAVSSLATDIH